MRLMRNFGFHGYDNVIHPGTNGKMIEVCAAMGLTNLDVHSDVVACNKRTHAAYSQAMEDIAGMSVLPYDQNESNSHHYVVIEVGNGCPASRDVIIEALHAENILARKYFWPGCHMMKPYRDLYPHSGLLLEHTRTVAQRVIVLPNGPTLPDGAIAVVASVLRVLAAETCT